MPLIIIIRRRRTSRKKKQSGRVQHHAWRNDLIHQANPSRNTRCQEALRSQQRQRKEIRWLALVPWQSGRSATWDVTVAHTLATSYVSQNALQTGSAAAAASARKSTKYSTLSATHMFFSSGCRDSWSLVRRSSQPHSRNRQKSHALHSDPRETTFLYQHFSVEVQHFNAVFLANMFTVFEFPL